jgi:hypothetical protein
MVDWNGFEENNRAFFFNAWEIVWTVFTMCLLGEETEIQEREKK